MPKFLTDIEWVDEKGETQGTNEYGVQLGNNSETTGYYPIAIGTSALAATNCIALGYYANAAKEEAVAIGTESSNDARGAITIGTRSHITGYANNGTILIGRDTYASSYGDSSVAIGERASVSGNKAVALGCMAMAYGGIAIGESACSENDTAITIGNGTNATYYGSISIGSGAKNIGENSVLLGAFGFLDGDESIVIGTHARQKSDGTDWGGNIVIGSHSEILGWSALPNTIVGNHVSAHNCQGVSYLGAGEMSSMLMLNGYQNCVILGNNSTDQLFCNVSSITYFSDSRLKEDVIDADINRCLEDVARLPVKRYKYKDFAGRHRDVHRTGFLADDVETVFPKDVYVHPEMEYEDRDGNGNLIMDAVLDESGNQVMEYIVNPTTGEAIPTPKYRPRKIKVKNVKMISMEMATPTLWGAVQALNQKNNMLQSRIDALDGEVERLKFEVDSSKGRRI